MKPESRKTQLLTQTVGDELVIYDEQSHEAHRLSPTAALVWRSADGQRSLAELSSTLRASLDPSASAELSEEDGDDLVRLALDELNRVGLLSRGLPGIGEAMTRREMLGVSAALLPVIASILAPTPAMAQTIPTSPFAQFGGTYVGPGTPGTPNACGIGAGQTTITLSFAFGGVATMTIRHAGGTIFTVAPAAVTPISATQIRVTGNSVFTGGYQSTNNFVFTLGAAGTASVAGAQQISYPECGTTPYNVTGTRTGP